MSDQYTAVRNIPLLTVFGWLGVDVSLFKHRNGKNGSEHYGKCIFHESKTNVTCFSFTADLAHCFGCEVKFRGAIDAVKEYRKCNFKDAVAFLEERAGKEPPKQKEPDSEANNASGELVPYKGTYEKYKVPCPWLEERIPDQAVRERYGVFCYNNPARKSAYSNRVMIPVRDIQSTLYGYLGRRIDDDHEDSPKYLFPKNLPKSRFLFGAYELGQLSGKPVQLPLKLVYLVESPFCVLKFAIYGLPAVSPFGWSVSAEQIELLTTLAKGIVYLPDRNKMQESGAHVATLAARMWVRFPPLPDGIDDPEQMTKEQILAL